MGYKLYRHVLDHAPADLAPLERFVLAVYADDANDATRTGWPPDELVAHRTGLTVTGVRKVLRRLTRRGYELRVVRRVGKDGRPVYAWRNSVTHYRIPTYPQRDVPSRERATPTADPSDEKGLPLERERPTPNEGKGLPPWVDPSPQSPQVPSSDARAREDRLADLVAETLEKTRPNKTITEEWAVKVARDLLNRYGGKPDSYFRQTIESRPDDFTPNPGPRQWRDGRFIEGDDAA